MLHNCSEPINLPQTNLNSMTMKKTFAICCILTLALSAPAQEFRVGLKGGINSTWLFNKNVSDAGDNLDYDVTFGNTKGIATQLQLNDNVGVGIDLLFASHKQKYTGKSTSTSFESEINLSYLDIPIMFRLSSEKGPYFEVGPQVSILMNAKEDYARVPSSSVVTNYVDREFKDDFNSTNLAFAFGFGVDIEVTDQIMISPGLRFAYGLADATAELPLTEFTGTNVFNHSAVAQFSHFDGAKYSYVKSNTVAGGLIVGAVYRLGR
jgi:opacity protein-like surface antigen